MTQVRLGVVGLGAMGSELLAVAAAHPEYDVRIAADLDPAARARAAEAHPEVTVTGEIEEVFGAGIDALYVATPPRTHADLALRALDAGLAVFCEKPLAVDLAEGEAMAKAAAAAEVGTGVNYALSDRAEVLEIERALRTGELGEPRSVEIRLAFPQWPRAFQADALWLDRREQGGFLREVFSHFAYLTDRLLGELTPLWQDVRWPANSEAAEVAATAVFEAGGVPVRVWAESGSARPETYEWTLHGTQRSYRLADWSSLTASSGGTWETVAVSGEPGSEHTRLTAFAAAVRREPAPNLATFADALRVQRVVEGWLAT